MADFEKLVSQINEKTPVVEAAVNKLDEQTRSEIARDFVKLYFRILIIILIVVPTYNIGVLAFSDSAELLLPLKDILLTFSAAIGPALGLVIAYYFKSNNN